MNITRRAALCGMASAPALVPLTAVALPTETPLERYRRARAELLSAMKELHPDQSIWHVVDGDDDGVRAGVCMIVGHEVRS